MALLRCFFPMKPLGHRVSDTSSTGTTRGEAVDEAVDAWVRDATE